MNIPPHSISYRVYYEDTDAMGLVYHANYLKFAERARTEYLRSLGISQSRVMESENILFVVYQMQVQFKMPAKLDDLLTIDTTITDVKKASLKMHQIISLEKTQLTTLTSWIACVNLDKKPVLLPAHISRLLKTS